MYIYTIHKHALQLFSSAIRLIWWETLTGPFSFYSLSQHKSETNRKEKKHWHMPVHCAPCTVGDLCLIPAYHINKPKSYRWNSIFDSYKNRRKKAHVSGETKKKERDKLQKYVKNTIPNWKRKTFTNLDLCYYRFIEQIKCKKYLVHFAIICMQLELGMVVVLWLIAFP